MVGLHGKTTNFISLKPLLEQLAGVVTLKTVCLDLASPGFTLNTPVQLSQLTRLEVARSWARDAITKERWQQCVPSLRLLNDTPQQVLKVGFFGSNRRVSSGIVFSK